MQLTEPGAMRGASSRMSPQWTRPSARVSPIA